MHFLHFASTLSFVSLALAWKTFTVPHSAGGLDDTPALTKAFAENPNLTTDATILFKEGVTYNILTPLRFPRLKNVLVSVQGNLTYATDIKATQAAVGSSSYPGAWLKFSGGYNVTLTGSGNPSWGWVNCHGQQWWDAGQTNNRPRALGFQGITYGEVKYIKVSQPVISSFGVSGSGIHIHHNTIMAISTSKATASNTDAFDVQGTDVLIEDNVIYNGDDCLAVGNKAKNIHFRNNYCNGGHGVSVGSLGKNGAVADVQNVLIENVVMEKSDYGARFKSWTGGQGIAKNITWKNITMNNVRYPIYITQRYVDKRVGSNLSSTSTGSTHIDTFTFQNIRGTVDDVSHSSGTMVTLDLYKGYSTGILVKDIQMKTLSGKPVSVVCDPNTISGDVGLECRDGVFKSTAAGK